MIRTARPDDSAAIADIWNAVIRDTALTFTNAPKAKEDISRRITQGRTWVAHDGGAVIGFVTYGPFRSGPGYAHSFEHSLHLATHARGRGIGRAMLRHAETQAAAEGGHVMVAGVSSANPGGRAFHLACGYSEVGVLPQVGRKFDQWFDLHLLTKRLV